VIIISPSLVVSRALLYTPDLPVVLFENLVTAANVVADEEDADFPATNLANPQTSSFWKSGSTADQYITVTLDGTMETDGLGVVRHNWGSALVVVSVEGITAEPGAVWTELVGERTLGDDTPVLFVFEGDFYVGLRLKLQPDAVEPQAAVIYAGPTLTLPRSVPVGHKPLKYSRTRNTIAGRATNGDFLGNIVLSQSLQTTFDVKLLDPDWYWEHGQPFVAASNDPFFLAWRPDSFPDECAFAWATNDPQPTISVITGELDISLNLDGLAL
jgi:hypothetical protein